MVIINGVCIVVTGAGENKLRKPRFQQQVDHYADAETTYEGVLCVKEKTNVKLNVDGEEYKAPYTELLKKAMEGGHAQAGVDYINILQNQHKEGDGKRKESDEVIICKLAVLFFINSHKETNENSRSNNNTDKKTLKETKEQYLLDLKGLTLGAFLKAQTAKNISPFIRHAAWAGFLQINPKLGETISIQDKPNNTNNNSEAGYKSIEGYMVAITGEYFATTDQNNDDILSRLKLVKKLKAVDISDVSVGKKVFIEEMGKVLDDKITVINTKSFTATPELLDVSKLLSDYEYVQRLTHKKSYNNEADVSNPNNVNDANNDNNKLNENESPSALLKNSKLDDIFGIGYY